VTTLLLLLLTLAVVAGIAAVAAGLVGGGLDDPTTTVPARELPPGPLRRADVNALRFVPALRGYRMDQVDAALDRLGAELERLQSEIADRERRLARHEATASVAASREPGALDPAGYEPGYRPGYEPGVPDEAGAPEPGAPVTDRPRPSA
jgi:DivIVA domain-containing protein